MLGMKTGKSQYPHVMSNLPEPIQRRTSPQPTPHPTPRSRPIPPKWPQTRRHILRLGPPLTLRIAQHQLQDSSFQKELMTQPILRIRLPIQCRTLNIHILILFIEVLVYNRSFFAGELVGDGDGLKERGCDEVDVLAGVGEDAHHGEGGEGAHGARVVVAGDAADGAVEVAGDVAVRAEAGEGGAAGVVVEE